MGIPTINCTSRWVAASTSSELASSYLVNINNKITYEAGINLRQVRDANARGCAGDLPLQQVDSADNAIRAIQVSIVHGAPDADGPHSQSQELHDVGAVAYAAVRVDLDLLEDRRVLLVDLEGDLDSRRGAVQGAAAVVRDEYGRRTSVYGFPGVFDRLDALGDDGERRQLLQLLVEFPRHAAVIDVTANAGVGLVAKAAVDGASPGGVYGQDHSLVPVVLDGLEQSAVLSFVVGGVDLSRMTVL